MARSSVKTGTILLLTSLGAACGSGQPSNSMAPSTPPPAVAPAPALDACSLLTPEAAGKILGSPAKATTRPSSAGRSACDFVTESYESFTLEVIWANAEDEIKAARAAGAASTGLAGGAGDPVVSDAMGVQRVDDLGDEAYFSRRTMSYVRKGDKLLVFHTAGLNDGAREHWAALARSALARLP